jgi:predicted metal-dependent HD superfamily phosphohydrolase
MSQMGQDRWFVLAGAFGVADATTWYARLSNAYSEPHRHYHNQQHIAECLREFDGTRAVAENPALVEAAIWFHDVVYDPRAGDNEERSADWATEFFRGSNASHLGEMVKRLVLVTKHHVASTPDEALLIDIDLSILGQPRGRFVEYEQQIRQEYSWVPANLFAENRSAILRRFLERLRIFTTEHFFSRYEAHARENLHWSLEYLRAES